MENNNALLEQINNLKAVIEAQDELIKLQDQTITDDIEQIYALEIKIVNLEHELKVSDSLFNVLKRKRAKLEAELKDKNQIILNLQTKEYRSGKTNIMTVDLRRDRFPPMETVNG